MEPSSSDAYPSVVELCAILQCLGFELESLNTTEGNVSQEGGSCTVVINCQESGINVILDSSDLSSSCPRILSRENSGFRQVSGMTGGRQFNEECGMATLGCLPKSRRERLTKEFQNIVRCIKGRNESDVEKKQEPLANKSARMLDWKTPEKRLQLKSETPTRYRSLDALTAKDDQLPAPGPLAKDDEKKFVCQRQRSTYTLSSILETSRIGNKTSSPIRVPSQSILDSLVAAEKLADDLRNRMSNIIRYFIEDGKHDSSISSLSLDISKISYSKVLMATNRPDTLDPALMRPGRLDRKVEFGLPELEGRAHIFRIHARSMSVERDIRFDLLARLCPNSTGAEIRSVCTEAGMFAIRARRKVATEKDFLEAVNKVIKSYAKFSATPRYMTYN